jgi:hypothetical protein
MEIRGNSEESDDSFTDYQSLLPNKKDPSAHETAANANTDRHADTGDLSGSNVNKTFDQLVENYGPEPDIPETHPSLGPDAPRGLQMVGGNYERTINRLATARTKLDVLYDAPPARGQAADIVKAQAEVVKVEQILSRNADKVERTAAAYAALDAAVHDPVKLEDLYAMGSSRVPGERAIARIALSGLKAAQRAYKAELMGATTAASLATMRKDLALQNTSELMDNTLRAGGDVPESKKPRGLKFWKRRR